MFGRSVKDSVNVINIMSNLPYNPAAGNGITNVEELYEYMTKCPLCLLDRSFMESYGRILCRAPWITHEYFTAAAQAVRLSDETDEMGLAEGIEERALEFNKYLQQFSEYDKEGCTSDADDNIIIHVLQQGGGWVQKYRRDLFPATRRRTKPGKLRFPPWTD